MSWDCDLDLHLTVDGNDIYHSCGSWNYTYNTSPMIYDALGMKDGSWRELIEGKGGAEGAEVFARIVAGLEAAPEKYRAMNPENGWGNYDDLLGVMREMRDAGRKWPSAKWSTS